MLSFVCPPILFDGVELTEAEEEAEEEDAEEDNLAIMEALEALEEEEEEEEEEELDEEDVPPFLSEEDELDLPKIRNQKILLIWNEYCREQFLLLDLPAPLDKAHMIN